jgi:hypothetical protein
VTDLYPILSHAALSTISEGMFLDPDEALFDIPYSVLGCSTRDLGEAFVTNNQRIM